MKYIKYILVVGLTFMGFMLLMEVFIMGTGLAEVSSTEIYSDIGRGRRTDLNYTMFTEGFGMGHFNKYRYLNKAYPPEKSPGVYRIALLGDSFVEGFQVFDRDHFRTYIENNLSTKAQPVEVLNFGRSGFHLGYMYGYDQLLVSKFNADLVLYFLSVADIYPQSDDQSLPNTFINSDDSLIVRDKFSVPTTNISKVTRFLAQHSYTMNMIRSGKVKMSRVPLGYILLEKIYTWIYGPLDNLGEEGSENEEGPIPEITKRIVAKLDPDRVIVVNRDAQRMPDDFIQLLKENNIQYIDLFPLTKKLKDNGMDINYWKITGKFGHWNYDGHREVGNYISSELKNSQRLQRDK